MGSETGALCVDPACVIEKGRLEPGKIFVADLDEGRIISDDEEASVASRQPYAQWLEKQNSNRRIANACGSVRAASIIWAEVRHQKQRVTRLKI